MMEKNLILSFFQFHVALKYWLISEQDLFCIMALGIIHGDLKSNVELDLKVGHFFDILVISWTLICFY